MSLLLLFNPDVILQRPAKLVFSPTIETTLLTFGDPGMTINVGDKCAVPIQVQDGETGAFVDPDTLTFFVLAPDGTSATYVYNSSPNVQRLGQGLYRLLVYLTMPKRWNVVAITTGALQGRESWSFEAYGTVADVALPP